MIFYEWRRHKKLTKEAAGRLIGVSGVSIGRYEAGRVPDANTLRRIIAVTDGAVLANDFFGIAGETKRVNRSGQPGYRRGAAKKRIAGRRVRK